MENNYDRIFFFAVFFNDIVGHEDNGKMKVFGPLNSANFLHPFGSESLFMVCHNKLDQEKLEDLGHHVVKHKEGFYIIDHFKYNKFVMKTGINIADIEIPVTEVSLGSDQETEESLPDLIDDYGKAMANEGFTECGTDNDHEDELLIKARALCVELRCKIDERLV